MREPGANEVAIRDRRRRGFFMVDNIAVDRFAKLGSPFVVYCVLLRHSRERTTFISHSRIGRDAGLSIASVKRGLDELERVGLIRKLSGKGEGTENIYEVCELVENTLETGAKPVQEIKPEPERVAHFDEVGSSSDESRVAQNFGAIRNNKTKSNKTKKPALFDYEPPLSDWTRIINRIEENYQRATGLACPWGDKRVFAELKRVLGTCPKWTCEDWLRAIDNRFISQDANPSEPPAKWVKDLPRYAAGPLNKFHLPLEPDNGPKTNTRKAAESLAQRWSDEEETQDIGHVDSDSGDRRGDVFPDGAGNVRSRPFGVSR